MDRVDFTPSALRADLSGSRDVPGYLYSAAELIDRAADLLSDSAGLVHDNARARVSAAGVDMNLVHGDVTDLGAAGIGGEFRLVLDSGTFHDFKPDQQQAMALGVDAVASSDATILLLCWPRRHRPLIRGVDRDEIEAVFPTWKITDVEPSGFTMPKPLELILRPDEHWFRLRRT